MNDECGIPDVKHNSLSAELARVVRYGTAAIGGYLVSQGYMSQELVEMVSGVLVTATPILVGMALAKIQRQQFNDVVNLVKKSKGDSNPKGD